MASSIYPAGAPQAGYPLPGPDGPLDSDLLAQQAGIRRRRSPFEPPAPVGMTPRIVPRSLFRAAQADDIRTHAEALAAQQDALDLGHNADVQAWREKLSGFSTPDDLVRIPERVVEPTNRNVIYLQQRTTAALAQMRRQLQGDEVWAPPPPGSPPPPHPGELLDSVMMQLGTVAANAGASYRGEPPRAPGALAIVSNAVGPLARFVRDTSTVLNPVTYVTQSPGDSVADLTRAAHAMGRAFDGRAFWRNLTVDYTAAIATAASGGGYEEYRARAAARFDEEFAALPRPAQLFVEELNPGNVAIALAGGPLANVLKASGVRGAGFLANIIEPMARNPLKAVGLEVGASAAGRGGFEATEGAPLPVRAGAALLAGGGFVAFEQGAEAGVRAAFNALKPEAIEPALRAFVDGQPLRPVDIWRKGIVDETPEMVKNPPPPGTIVRAERARDGKFTTYRVTDDGSMAPFYLGPKPGVENLVRTDAPNIARGRKALTSRIDMEVRLGGLDPEAAMLATEFAKRLPRGYLADLGSSFVQGGISPEAIGGAQAGESVIGLYDPSRMVMQIAKAALDRSADPARTMVHEISHHLEQFVSANDARSLVRQFNREMKTKGREAIARYDITTEQAAELNARINPEGSPRAGTPAERAELGRLNRLRAEQQRAAYRYRSFQEWFAENITDQFNRELDREARPAATNVFTRVARTVQDFAGAMADALKHVGGRQDIESVYRNLKAGKYDPDLRRNMLLDLDMPATQTDVGFIPASPAHSAIGEGGAIKAGSPDEMLSATTQEVMDAWRGDVLEARIIPHLTSRPRRPAGNKAIPIPDVLPAPRPTTARGVVSQSPQVGGIASAQLGSASQRAADLAAQLKTAVPSGVMHNIQRGEAEFAGLDPGLWDIVNGAPESVVLRQGIVAAEHARSEMATRIVSSRAQFLGRVKEMFGSTDRLPERIDYIGPADRPLFGKPVAAAEHPLTGTIRDFFENPQFYSEPLSKYLPEFTAYDARNRAVSNVLETEFGREIGEFDTGIAGGIFFPNYDAGIGRAARGFDAPPVSPGGSFRTRTYQTMTERLAEADQALTEPVTDLAETFARLDGQKVSAAQAETFRHAVGGSLTPVDGWQEVPALEMLGGQKVWLPPEQAKQVAEYLTARESSLANIIQQIKGVRLNADTSPLTIGGSIGWATSPAEAAKDMALGLARGVREGNPLRPFTDAALYQDIAAAPDRWLAFFTHMDMAPGGGTPAEWRAGFLEKIPLVGRAIGNLNDGAMNAIMRGMEADFDSMTQTFVRHGLPLDVARAEAANQAKMTWLQSNATELGVSRGRRSIERAVPVSPTYIRQPVNFMSHAVAGFAKLAAAPQRTWGTQAQWSRLDAREVMAAHRFAKMAGTFAGIAAVTAAVTAEARGYSPADAVKRAVFDVDGPDWMTAQLGGGVKLPLGGPYRALLRAMAPGRVEGFGDYVPFAGMKDWTAARVNPAASTAVRTVVTGKDFYGNEISPDDGPLGIAQSLIYAANQSVPILAGVPYEAWRAGRGPQEAGIEAAFQFLGQSPQQEVARQTWEREQRLGARALYNLTSEQKAAAGMTAEQVSASAGSRSLAELRRAVGTRTASKLTALVNPDVAAARAAYVDDLRRRADLGDRDAEALVVSVDTQERLQALATRIADGGELDRVAYREQRGTVISEMVGKSEAFQKVFEGYRQSDSEIDRLSSAWYDLFDQATSKQTINGREVSAGVDFEVFSKLEDAFFAGMDPDKAALVQQNIAVAPLGAGPAEEELRLVRADLQRAGYWDIEDNLWSQWRPMLQKGVEAEGVPQEVRDAVARADTFAEFSMGIRRYLEGKLVDQGFDPGVAVQVAKSQFTSLPEVRGFDRDMQSLKRDWAEQNAESGLALRAQIWGYLSDSIINLDASGAIPGAQPNAPAGPAADPSRGKPNPPPRSEAIVPPIEQLLAEAANGTSYGQLAVRYGTTRDAIRNRIRRANDGAGVAALRV